LFTFSLDRRGSLLVDTLEDLSCYVLNGRTASDCPANYTYVGRGKSIIDLIACNLHTLSLVRDLHTVDLPLSDHVPVCLTLNMFCRTDPVYDSAPLRKIIVNRTNCQSVVDEISKLNPPQCMSAFKLAIVQTCLSCGIMRDVRHVCGNKPWYDSECKVARRNLNLIYNLFRSNPNTANLTELQLSRKMYCNLIKSKRRLYSESIQRDLSDCNSTQAFWKAVNKFRGARKPAALLLSQSGKFFMNI